MSKPKPDTNTADDLLLKLRERFPKQSWALIPQVRNTTGFSSVIRTADALAMSLWPSRGLHLHGFEIKTNHYDWIRELKNPQKAEEIAQFCDFWWVVTPKDIVNVDEVPTNWGLLFPHGKTLKIKKQAKQLESLPIDKAFLAAILRQAQEIFIPEGRFTASYQKGFAEGQKQSSTLVEYERDEYKKLEKYGKKTIGCFGIKAFNQYIKEEDFGLLLLRIALGCMLIVAHSIPKFLGDTAGLIEAGEALKTIGITQNFLL